MSNPALTDTQFNFSKLNAASTAGKAGSGSLADDPLAAANAFAAQFADVKTQMFQLLLTTQTSTSKSSSSSSDPLGALQGTGNGAQSTLTGLSSSLGLSASGMNMSLFDPKAGYNMMSTINSLEVSFKAQYVGLSDMKSALSGMQSAGQTLEGDVSIDSSNDIIRAELEAFAQQYNAWVERFQPDLQKGGVLANTQAAQLARHELDQNINSIFNGAHSGIHGLYDIGLSIDPTTKLASLDTGKLNSMLASNKQGVVDTIDQFAANFAGSAAMLNTDGSIMPRQMSNLSRAIAYISDNKSSLQAEFGMGDAVKPGGQLAKALASYEAISAGKTQA